MHNKNKKYLFRPPSHTKNIKWAFLSDKCHLFYILIAILFFVQMKVNVEAILDFSLRITDH